MNTGQTINIEIMKKFLALILIICSISLKAQISFKTGAGIGNANSWSSQLIDIDNDGDLDVFVNNSHYQIAQQNSLWINDGVGNFTIGDNPLLTGETYFGDFNSDNTIDVVANDSIYINNGTGEFNQHFAFMDLAEGNYFFSDINSDGLIDVILLTQSQTASNVSVFCQSNGYAFSKSWDTTYSFWVNQLLFQDINKDGQVEMFLAVSDGPNKMLSYTNGTLIESQTFTGANNTGTIVFADFNSDGNIDLLEVNLHLSSNFSNVHSDVIWLNMGDGTFTKGHVFPKIMSMGAVACDFDYDGDIDIYTASSQNKQNKLWLNNNKGGFEEYKLDPIDATSGGVSIGDLDGDSDMDLFITCFNMANAKAPNYVLFNTTILENVVYFNEPGPGNAPKLFAPEQFAKSGENTHTLSISPNFNELLFTRLPEGKTYRMQLKYGVWSSSETFIDGQEGIYSPDGNRIYYQDGNIHYLEKEGVCWSDRQSLTDAINTDKFEYYTTVAENGNLYYTRSLSIGNPKIFKSNESNLSNSKELSGSINDYDAYHPYISKNDSFIIFNSATRPDSYGNADLYISYRNSSGHFGEPINLGNQINSSDADICPTLSPDGKYMFFTRLGYDDEHNWTGKLFWVSTGIIKELQPTGISNIQQTLASDL